MILLSACASSEAPDSTDHAPEACDLWHQPEGQGPPAECHAQVESWSPFDGSFDGDLCASEGDGRHCLVDQEPADMCRRLFPDEPGCPSLPTALDKTSGLDGALTYRCHGDDSKPVHDIVAWIHWESGAGLTSYEFPGYVAFELAYASDGGELAAVRVSEFWAWHTVWCCRDVSVEDLRWGSWPVCLWTEELDPA